MKPMLLTLLLCLPTAQTMAQVWKTDLFHEQPTPPLSPEFQVANGASLYTLSHGSIASVLSREDLVSGQHAVIGVWESSSLAMGLDSDGALLIALSDQIIKMSTIDHQPVWTRNLYEPAIARIDAGRIYLGRPIHLSEHVEVQVQAIDGATGLDLWQVTLPDDATSIADLSVNAGTVAVVVPPDWAEETSRMRVFAFDTHGSQRWTQDFADPTVNGGLWPAYLSALDNGNVLATGHSGGTLVPYLLDAINGEILTSVEWTHPGYPVDFDHGARVFASGELLRTANCTSTLSQAQTLCLQRVDPADGATIWSAQWIPEVPESLWTYSQIDLTSADGRLFAAVPVALDVDRTEIRVLAFDLSNGDLLWTQRYDADVPSKFEYPMLSAQLAGIQVTSGQTLFASLFDGFSTGGLVSLRVDAETGSETRRGQLTIPALRHPTTTRGIARDSNSDRVPEGDHTLTITSAVSGIWDQLIAVRADNLDLSDGSIRSRLGDTAVPDTDCVLPLRLRHFHPARHDKLLSLVTAVCGGSEYRPGIARFDRNDGSLDWARLDGIAASRVLELENGELVLGASNTSGLSLRKLSPDGLDQVWSQSLATPGTTGVPGAPVLLQHTSGSLIAATRIDAGAWWILALDPSSGGTLWQRLIKLEEDQPSSRFLLLSEGEDGVLELAGVRRFYDGAGRSSPHFAVERISPIDGQSVTFAHAAIGNAEGTHLSRTQRLSMGRYAGIFWVPGTEGVQGIFSFDSSTSTVQTRTSFSGPGSLGLDLDRLGGTDLLVLERQEDPRAEFARVWRIDAADLNQVIATRGLRVDPADMNAEHTWAEPVSIHGMTEDQIVVLANYWPADGFGRPRAYRFDADYFDEALFADGFD